MSERRSNISKALTIGTVALAPPFLSLGLLLLVIWALRPVAATSGRCGRTGRWC